MRILSRSKAPVWARLFWPLKSIVTMEPCARYGFTKHRFSLNHAHGFEALTDLMFVYHVTEEYNPADPDEHGIPWDDSRVIDLWSTRTPTLSARDRDA